MRFIFFWILSLFSIGVAAADQTSSEASIKRIVANVEKLFESQNRGAGVGGKTALRTFHAKGVCVFGKMYVEADLPQDLKVGIFATNNVLKPIPVYARWAPGLQPHSDLFPDPAYGATFHAEGIEGERWREGDAYEKASQTWVTANYPIFFSPDNEYEAISEVMRAGAEGDRLAMLKYLGTHLHTQLITDAMIAQLPHSPFHRTYWSQTPYKFGDRDAKWKFSPCGADHTLAFPSADMFEAQMNRQLENGPVCFNVGVQFSLDPKLMPVNDSTVWWPEPGYWTAPGIPEFILGDGLTGETVEHMITRTKEGLIAAGRKAESEIINFLSRLLPENRKHKVARPAAHLLPKITSPFRTVAKIYFQATPSPAQLRNLCQHMVNSPAQALKVFRGQGFINEVRASVYEMGARRRLELNHVPHLEPTGNWRQDIEAFDKAARHLTH
jgi:hypothetical protein